MTSNFSSSMASMCMMCAMCDIMCCCMCKNEHDRSLPPTELR